MTQLPIRSPLFGVTNLESGNKNIIFDKDAGDQGRQTWTESDRLINTVAHRGGTKVDVVDILCVAAEAINAIDERLGLTRVHDHCTFRWSVSTSALPEIVTDN